MVNVFRHEFDVYSCGDCMKNFKFSLVTRCAFYDRVDELLAKNPNQQYYGSITPKPKKRSIPANNQYYVWLPAISDFICEDLKTTRQIIKLDFGLPIILADDQIGDRYGRALNKCGFFAWTREQQIEHMEFIQVTSLMNTKQHNQMRDNILYFYNQAGLNIGYEND